MSKGILDKSIMRDIADAVREKGSTEETYTPREMAQAIRAIPTGIPGPSAYEVAVSNGFVGTEEEWLTSLKQPALDAAAQITDIRDQGLIDCHDLDALTEEERDDSEILLCGQPSILFGEGTPQEAVVPYNWKQLDPDSGTGYNWNGEPSAMGQQYIDVSADPVGHYIAVRKSYNKASENYYSLIWKQI